jgi:uncharacterized protein (DUF302 family)
MKKLMLLLTGLLLTLPVIQAQEAAFEKISKYDFQKTVEIFKGKATEAGWAIPVEHDMQATLKKKDKEILPATILVLCNANIAYKLLNNDETRITQTMLPCRVAIYEKSDGKTYVAWSNYAKAGEKINNETASVFKDISKGIKDLTSSVTK